jgi:hypothetical protein
MDFVVRQKGKTMRLIDADHLRRWILSRVFKTQLNVADVIDQIDREDTIELHPEIIRCNDCMHNGSYDTDCPIYWNGKEYCSFAERITDEGSD